MRLSELRPCDSCRGPVMAPPVHRFYVLRVDRAVLNQVVATEVLAKEAATRSLAIAESMVDKPGDAVQFMGDLDPGNTVELHLCGGCYGRTTVEGLVHRVTAARRTA